MRVLVVEDERESLSGLVELLREDGFDAVGVANGREALEAVVRFRPDVVLTDLIMPVMGGHELVLALHAIASGIPIFVITAREDQRLDGVEAVLQKPIDYGDLVTRVRRAALAR